MTKVIIINGSPRKNFNTAKLLKEAARGAQDAGAEVEYVNLYDINYKGCISCLICKRKGIEQKGLCFYKDDLRPLLEKCLNADAVIIGSPVYHSYPTGMMRSFLERFMFPAHTYMIDKQNGGLKRVLNHTLPTALIFTMNATEEQFRQHHYDVVLGDNEMSLRAVFGYCETLYAFDTFQYTDYAKYDCDLFDAEHKAKMRDEQFPKDMEKAYEIGKRLATITKQEN
ncbi:MAG: flavodoxin family protein [Alphaproteobacteria bacterium]|nr:flavodoxin family protein [Alphaproteobacteria bacterium]